MCHSDHIEYLWLHWNFAICMHFLRCCYTRQFFLQLATQCRFETSCGQNSLFPTCLAMKNYTANCRNCRLFLSFLFDNVEGSVYNESCNKYFATCLTVLSSSVLLQVTRKNCLIYQSLYMYCKFYGKNCLI